MVKLSGFDIGWSGTVTAELMKYSGRPKNEPGKQ